MTHQKHLFQLPKDIHYLNGAYMSPLLKSVEEAGMTGIIKKRNPITIKPSDFFSEADEVRLKFSKIINCEFQQVAIIPSASYGLKTAINNLPINNGNHAIIVSEEFPSGYYTLIKWCNDNSKQLKTIEAPDTYITRGEDWNNRILEAINFDTSVVVISTIHWTDGTIFNLKRIGERCKEVNAIFIVDGTQSVGALPIDIATSKIDALICAGYKWLMGPYSIGLAYYGDFFNNGVPIEDTWMNKSNADNFSSLTSYVNDYKIGSSRYNVGEFSNFILMPMLNKALEQIIDWQVTEIQNYCDKLIQPLTTFLKENEFWIEHEKYRASHLFGFLLPRSINQDRLLEELQKRKVYISLRGKAIRVSTHLYNDKEDIKALIEILSALKHKNQLN